MRRQIEPNRRKREDPAYAAGNHLIGDLLRHGGGSRDNTDLDTCAADGFFHFRDRGNDDTADILTDNPMIHVKEAFRSETEPPESFIIRKGPA